MTRSSTHAGPGSLASPLSAAPCLLLLFLLPSGCGVYRSSYRYFPRPLEAQVLLEEDVVGARALLSVVGIRRADSEQGRPSEVEVRLRLENRTDDAIFLEKGSLLLLSGDLVEFGEPRIEQPLGEEIAPGAAASYTLFFAIPDEDALVRELDLDGLNLRWTVAFPGAGRSVTVGSTFERAFYPDDDDRGWRYGFGIGSSYCY